MREQQEAAGSSEQPTNSFVRSATLVTEQTSDQRVVWGTEAGKTKGGNSQLKNASLLLAHCPGRQPCHQSHRVPKVHGGATNVLALSSRHALSCFGALRPVACFWPTVSSYLLPVLQVPVLSLKGTVGGQGSSRGIDALFERCALAYATTSCGPISVATPSDDSRFLAGTSIRRGALCCMDCHVPQVSSRQLQQAGMPASMTTVPERVGACSAGASAGLLHCISAVRLHLQRIEDRRDLRCLRVPSGWTLARRPDQKTSKSFVIRSNRVLRAHPSGRYTGSARRLSCPHM